MKQVLMLASLFGITSLSNASNELEGGSTEKDKQNSLFFKMSRNSNRINLFEQLQSRIRIKSSKSNFAYFNAPAVASYSTMADVIELLGEPNVRMGNSFVYTLNPGNGCKAVLEFDASKNVIYIGVKDCR